METVNLSVALFKKANLSVQGTDNRKNLSPDERIEIIREESATFTHILEKKKPSLKSSRRFKIALVTCYAFLISLFAGIVYIGKLVDPKFPF